MSKAQVGISSVWYSGNPCNMHLMDLNHKVRQGVEKAGLIGMQFNTIGVRYALELWVPVVLSDARAVTASRWEPAA